MRYSRENRKRVRK